MNNANRTALELMLAEAIREKNAALYAVLVSGGDEQIQALLDGFFR
jgi:hypothetical protein